MTNNTPGRTYDDFPCGCRGYAEPREGEIGRLRLVIQVSPACRFDADKVGRKLGDFARYEA